MATKDGRKTGGRVAGTKNREKQKVIDQLAKLGCNPMEGLFRISQRAELEGDLTVATRCLSELSSYCYPKLKAVEVKTDREDPVSFHITLSDSLQLINDAAKNSGIVPEPKEAKPVLAEPPPALITKTGDDQYHAKTDYVQPPKIEAAPAAAWGGPLHYDDSGIV